MEGSTLRLGFLISIIGVIALLLWKDRENVERRGILFFRKTQRGIDFIDRTAKRAPKFWNLYAWFGVLAAFCSMGLITFLVGDSMVNAFINNVQSESLGLVAPGTGSSVSTQPGVTFVPAEAWFISIGILMAVHELSHGIIARLEGFEINSVGVLVLGVIPGAFVEPEGENMLSTDNEDIDSSSAPWDQGNWKSRLKVLSAGSWANYLTAGVFFLVLVGFSSLAATDNIYYNSQSGFPASNAGMDQGRLISFNGTEVENISSFAESADRIKANETYTIVSSEGSFNVTAVSTENDEEGFIGLSFSPYTPLQNWFSSLLSIIAVLNLGIGMFNMLPAKPLDGGHMVDTVVREVLGEEYSKYVNIWSTFVILSIILLLLHSILGPF